MRLHRFCTALALIALALPPAAAHTLFGRIVAVSDGDTLTVLGARRKQERVRLIGIDAPEHGQPYGTAARRNLARLALQKDAVVLWKTRDRYGRLVGKVRVAGRDVGLEQLESGYAWHYRQYSRQQSPADRATYAEAVQRARSARRELWSDRAAVPPWEWRRNDNAAASTDETAGGPRRRPRSSGPPD